MTDGLQWDTTDTIWNDLRRMAVNNTVDTGKALVQFAVDVAFDEARGSIRIYRSCVRDLVFDYVTAVGDECRSKIARHEEVGDVVRVANTHMTISIQDSIIMEYVQARDQSVEKGR